MTPFTAHMNLPTLLKRIRNVVNDRIVGYVQQQGGEWEQDTYKIQKV